MNPPRVVKLRRKNGIIIQDCDIYIGRNIQMGGWNLPRSKWANPYSIQEYGREECLKKYREFILTSDLLKDLDELSGKTLGCWCAPQACHGDILVELWKLQNIE